MMQYIWNTIYPPFACVFLLWLGTFAMSRKHTRELNLIWYLNSLFFLVFYVLSLVAERKNTQLTAICGSYQTVCDDAYGALTNIQDEVVLIATFSAIAVIPQILGYLLSGLSGVASSPKFLGHVRSVAVWSWIKFLAALSGIQTGQLFAKMTAGRQVSYSEFLDGFALIALAFMVAGFYCGIDDEEPGWFRRRFSFLVRNIHSFCTRSIPPIEEVKATPYLIEVHVNLPELSQLAKLKDSVSVQAHLNAR